jgi:hypothetical protein
MTVRIKGFKIFTKNNKYIEILLKKVLFSCTMESKLSYFIQFQKIENVGVLYLNYIHD